MLKYLALLLSLSTTFYATAQQNQIVSNSATNVYKFVEEMPDAPYNWFEFVANNVKYPEQAKKEKVEGKVMIQMVVRKDGSLDNLKVLRSSGNKLLDDEAMRVVKLMPNWIPGKEGGVPVDVYFTLPFNFKL